MNEAFDVVGKSLNERKPESLRISDASVNAVEFATLKSLFPFVGKS